MRGLGASGSPLLIRPGQQCQPFTRPCPARGTGSRKWYIGARSRAGRAGATAFPRGTNSDNNTTTWLLSRAGSLTQTTLSHISLNPGETLMKPLEPGDGLINTRCILTSRKQKNRKGNKTRGRRLGEAGTWSWSHSLPAFSCVTPTHHGFALSLSFPLMHESTCGQAPPSTLSS